MLPRLSTVRASAADCFNKAISPPTRTAASFAAACDQFISSSASCGADNDLVSKLFFLSLQVYLEDFKDKCFDHLTIRFKYCLCRSNKNQHALMLFNGNRFRHTVSSVPFGRTEAVWRNRFLLNNINACWFLLLVHRQYLS